MLSPETLNLTLRALAERYAVIAAQTLGDRLVAIALFGSAARGDATPHSDIDLFIVLKDAPDGVFARSALLEPVREQMTPLLQPLWDMQVYTDFSEVIRSEPELAYLDPLHLDLATQAVPLFDRQHVLEQSLDRLRQKIRRGEIVERHFEGIRYWDLEPHREPLSERAR